MASKEEVDTKERLFAQQVKVTEYDWEWIIVKVTSLTNLPKEGDRFGGVGFIWSKLHSVMDLT